MLDLGTWNSKHKLWTIMPQTGLNQSNRVQVKVTVFILVSEKSGQGQGDMYQRSRSKVLGQNHRVNIKAVGGVFHPMT